MTVATPLRPNRLDHFEDRVDLAAAFRWTARLNLHEGVANHFSVAVNDDGTQFLMNPNQMHFSRIKASDLLLLDANDVETMNRPPVKLMRGRSHFILSLMSWRNIP